jgi:hypothetical protein
MNLPPIPRPIRHVSTALLFAAAALAAVAAEGRPGGVSYAAHPAVARVAVVERNGTSYGSGTLVAVHRDCGLVVTNWHVVRDAAGPVTVLFPDGFQSAAAILAVDRDWDLAALWIWRPRAEPVPLAREAPRPGEVLTIAGHGKGTFRAASGRCTQYVAPGSRQPFEMVEVAATAREGDSGGPILNGRGELAGVLFGSSFGRTAGSYSGRVERFLTPLLRQLDAGPDAGPDTSTMIAQRPPGGQAEPAPRASIRGVRPAQGQPGGAGAEHGPPEQWEANPAWNGGTVAAAPAVAGRYPPIDAPASHSADVAWASSPADATMPVPILGEPAPHAIELFKTILAWIGGVLLVFHALRLVAQAAG